LPDGTFFVPLGSGAQPCCAPFAVPAPIMIGLTFQPIDIGTVLESVRTPSAGAVVLFVGTVRDASEGRPIQALEYEAYQEMAQRTLADLEREARSRWPLLGCAVVHRLGRLAVGDVAVALAVSAAHRQAAFEAGQWLIDRIKQVVPIWKCEHLADGTRQWVHPNGELPSPSSGGPTP